MPFAPHIKYHLGIGFVLGLWIYIFLIVIGPFDVSPLSFHRRIESQLAYGLFFCFSYYCIIPLQNSVYKKLIYWNILAELMLLAVVFFICFFPCYIYYKTDWMMGEYPLAQFIGFTYLPFMLIITPLLLFARWSVFKYGTNPKKQEEKISLSGENHLDVLNIPFADLICVKSANNYVEVNYQKNGKLHKKLLRTTTKKIQEELPDLVRIHRSCLINPMHFIEWKNNKTLALTHLEVVVSDTYKKQLSELPQFRP